MTRYVALLRGINVGKAKRVSMHALRSLAEGLGYSEVATYINSGNLLLTSSKRAATLAAELQRAITEELSMSVDVAVRSRAELERVLEANPYPHGDPAQVTVAFLTGPAPATAAERVAATAADHEPYTFAGSEIYVNYTHGLANSVLAAQFSKIIGVSATVRNVRTLGKIADLCVKQGG